MFILMFRVVIHFLFGVQCCFFILAFKTYLQLGVQSRCLPLVRHLYHIFSLAFRAISLIRRLEPPSSLVLVFRAVSLAWCLEPPLLSLGIQSHHFFSVSAFRATIFSVWAFKATTSSQFGCSEPPSSQFSVQSHPRFSVTTVRVIFLSLKFRVTIHSQFGV